MYRNKALFYNWKMKLKLKAKKAKEFSFNVLGWCVENKELAALLIPFIFGMTAKTTKSIKRRTQKHHEEVERRTHIYDRSEGHYWRLRRPLSSKEWVNVSKRKESGESYRDIFNSMNVLK